MPYTVNHFLQQVSLGLWNGCSFHRNAGHVVQGGPITNHLNPGARLNVAFKEADLGSVVFQEYHKDFPHKKYTMGYAGRPGGPDFYVSTVGTSLTMSMSMYCMVFNLPCSFILLCVHHFRNQTILAITAQAGNPHMLWRVRQIHVSQRLLTDSKRLTECILSPSNLVITKGWIILLPSRVQLLSNFSRHHKVELVTTT